MEDTMIVYRGRDGLMIYKVVAEIMGLKEGQSLDEPTFWEAIRNNAEYGIALCKAGQIREKINGPLKPHSQG